MSVLLVLCHGVLSSCAEHKSTKSTRFCGSEYTRSKTRSGPLLTMCSLLPVCVCKTPHMPCSPRPRPQKGILLYLISPGFSSRGNKVHTERVTAAKDPPSPPYSRLLHSCPILASSLSVCVSSPQPRADYSY